MFWLRFHLSACSVGTVVGLGLRRNIILLLRDAMLARYILSLCACLSVRLSVSLSQVEALQRWLDLGSHKQRRTITQRLYFPIPKISAIPAGSPTMVAPNRGGVGKNGDFRPMSRYILDTMQDRNMVTIER